MFISSLPLLIAPLAGIMKHLHPRRLGIKFLGMKLSEKREQKFKEELETFFKCWGVWGQDQGKQVLSGWGMIAVCRPSTAKREGKKKGNEYTETQKGTQSTKNSGKESSPEQRPAIASVDPLGLKGYAWVGSPESST